MTGDVILGTLAAVSVAILILIPTAARFAATSPSLACFGIHLGVGLFIIVSFGATYDAASYHIAGLDYMRWLSGETPRPTFTEGKEGFPFLLGILYVTLGPFPHVGVVFNALAISLACALIGGATRAFGWPQAARMASWIFVLLPPVIFWPSLLGRESLALLLLSCMTLGAGMAFSSKPVLGAALIWSAFVAGLWVRPQVFSIVALALGIAFLAGLFFKRVSAAPAFLVAMPAIATGVLGISRGNALELEEVGQQREFLLNASTKSSVVTDGFDTPIGALLVIARDLPAAALGPFPWNWSINYWQLVLDSISWMTLLGLVIYALFALRTPFPAAILIIPGIGAILASAAIMGNWGILIRMRIHAIPMLVIIAALGVLEWRRRRALRRTGVLGTAECGSSSKTGSEE